MLCSWGNPCKCAIRYWQLSGKFVTEGSEGTGNSLANLFLGVKRYWQPSRKFLRGYWQILRIAHICRRVANSPLIICQKVLINNYPLEFVAGGIITLQDGCPTNKRRGNLFEIPLKNLIGYKSKKQLIVLKTIRVLSPNLVISIYTSCSSYRSRKTFLFNILLNVPVILCRVQVLDKSSCSSNLQRYLRRTSG